MSKTFASGSGGVDWAAVCDCGWAASSSGADAGRLRIEQLGISHAAMCEDDVVLERRGIETDVVRKLDKRWTDDDD